jgi:uncharacterized protein (DUF169 family)
MDKLCEQANKPLNEELTKNSISNTIWKKELNFNKTDAETAKDLVKMFPQLKGKETALIKNLAKYTENDDIEEPYTEAVAATLGIKA